MIRALTRALSRALIRDHLLGATARVAATARHRNRFHGDACLVRRSAFSGRLAHTMVVGTATHLPPTKRVGMSTEFPGTRWLAPSPPPCPVVPSPLTHCGHVRRAGAPW